MKSPPESALVRAVLAAYGAMPGVMLWRNNVGAARTADGRMVRFGQPGAADILGVVKRTLEVRTVVNPDGFQPHESLRRETVGQAIAIECKARGKKQSAAQRVWQAAFEAMGGVYVLAEKLSDAADGLQELFKENR